MHLRGIRQSWVRGLRRVAHMLHRRVQHVGHQLGARLGGKRRLRSVLGCIVCARWPACYRLGLQAA